MGPFYDINTKKGRRRTDIAHGDVPLTLADSPSHDIDMLRGNPQCYRRPRGAGLSLQVVAQHLDYIAHPITRIRAQVIRGSIGHYLQ